MTLALKSKIISRMKSILTLILAMSLPLMSAAQPIPDTPLIHVVGTSTVSVAPDEVHFNFAIITEGQDLADAKRRNKETASKVLEYLDDAGVEEKHIQTQYLNIGQRYRDWNRKDETKYYECSQTIKVCLKDIGQFEVMVEELLSLGIHNLSSPDFRTSDYRKLMDEARNKAVKAAQEKARDMAEALGQDIGDAHTISETQMNQHNPVMRGYANMAMDAGGAMESSGPGIATGEIEIRATIHAYFYLEASEKPIRDEARPDKNRK